MTIREYTRWTNERCKRGARIGAHHSELFVLQRDEPYHTKITRVCCAACEAEGDLAADRRFVTPSV